MDRGLLLYVREDSPSKTYGGGLLLYVREDSPSKTWIEVYYYM